MLAEIAGSGRTARGTRAAAIRPALPTECNVTAQRLYDLAGLLGEWRRVCPDGVRTAIPGLSPLISSSPRASQPTSNFQLNKDLGDVRNLVPLAPKPVSVVFRPTEAPRQELPNCVTTFSASDWRSSSPGGCPPVSFTSVASTDPVKNTQLNFLQFVADRAKEKTAAIAATAGKIENQVVKSVSDALLVTSRNVPDGGSCDSFSTSMQKRTGPYNCAKSSENSTKLESPFASDSFTIFGRGTNDGVLCEVCTKAQTCRGVRGAPGLRLCENDSGPLSRSCRNICM
jgi:hypothetical protein